MQHWEFSRHIPGMCILIDRLGSQGEQHIQCVFLSAISMMTFNRWWHLKSPKKGKISTKNAKHGNYSSWRIKDQLMSLAILFHFLCAQHVSDINTATVRSLRLCCWITTSVVLFSVRCVLEIWCGWVWVVSVLQAETQLQPVTRTLKTSRTKFPTHNEPRTKRPMW